MNAKSSQIAAIAGNKEAEGVAHQLLSFASTAEVQYNLFQDVRKDAKSLVVSMDYLARSIFTEIDTQIGSNVLMTVATELLKNFNKEDVVAYFRLACAKKDGANHLCIGLLSLDDASQASFQQSLIAMWWDKLMRTKTAATDVQTILSSVPIPIMTAEKLVSLDADVIGLMD
eukprot:12431396-Karenia_brevis.AAC.1